VIVILIGIFSYPYLFLLIVMVVYVCVVNGETDVTVGTNREHNSKALVVGDYVRLGATTADTVALTSGVYKVTALDSGGLQFTVDRPIEVPSGAYGTGGSFNQVIPSATAIAASVAVAVVTSSNTSIAHQRVTLITAAP